MFSIVFLYCSCMASNCLRICSISRRNASASCARAGAEPMATRPSTSVSVKSARMALLPCVTDVEETAGGERPPSAEGGSDFCGVVLEKRGSAGLGDSEGRAGDPAERHRDDRAHEDGERGDPVRIGQLADGMDGGDLGERTFGVVEAGLSIVVAVRRLAALDGEGDREQRQ